MAETPTKKKPSRQKTLERLEQVAAQAVGEDPLDAAFGAFARIDADGHKDPAAIARAQAEVRRLLAFETR